MVLVWMADTVGMMPRAFTRPGQISELVRLDCTAILRGMIPQHLVSCRDRELPAKSAAVFRRRQDRLYSGSPGCLGPRAEASFGMAATPHLANGLQALSMPLLSFAGRPVALMADLRDSGRAGWSMCGAGVAAITRSWSRSPGNSSITTE